jgi:hypothetical protein
MTPCEDLERLGRDVEAADLAQESVEEELRSLHDKVDSLWYRDNSHSWVVLGIAILLALALVCCVVTFWGMR